MKNILIPFMLVLLAAGAAPGQEFRGGLLGGLSTSEISGDRLTGPNKAGIYAGAFVNRYLTERSSLQMELDFIQKGSRKNPDSLSMASYLLRLNYIEIPVHYRYDFLKKFAFEVGLSYGALIRSYEEINTIEETNARKIFFKYDFSFNFGLFYKLSSRWKANVRYSNSILPVREHSSGQTYLLNLGQYNEVLSFVLFYEFLNPVEP